MIPNWMDFSYGVISGDFVPGHFYVAPLHGVSVTVSLRMALGERAVLHMPFPALHTHPGTAPQPLPVGTAGPSFLLCFFFKQNQQSPRGGFFPHSRQQDFVTLKSLAPDKAQHLSSSRIFLPWGWDRGDGGSGSGDLAG